MKLKNIAKWIPLLLLMMTVVVIVASWIGNIYDAGWRNLMSEDGIRWSVSQFIPNIEAAPVGLILLILITVSILVESGLLRAFRRRSLKKNRAMSVTILVFLLLCGLISFMLFLPDAILLSPFGTIAESPFMQGLCGIICLIIIIVSNVYGYSSGRFVHFSDAITAHTIFIMHSASYFVSLILSAELLACLNYTGMIVEGTFAFILTSYILYIVPLAIEIVLAVEREYAKG